VVVSIAVRTELFDCSSSLSNILSSAQLIPTVVGLTKTNGQLDPRSSL